MGVSFVKKNDTYMVVISFDSLSSKDYNILKECPNFRFIMEEGAYVKEMGTIYPSLTYPIHTTIITGRYPKDHGIINNKLLQPGRISPDWYWYEKYIKGDTIFKAAKRKGLTTAALLWPVTAKGNINYNMPEIFPNRPWQNQIFISLSTGTPILLSILQKRFGYIRRGIHQPALDKFVTYSASYVIRKHRPSLIMIHFTDVDTQRHNYGYSSKEAMDAIKRYDIALGKLIETLKENNIWDKTTLIALSDHSQIDVYNSIKLNILFKRHGLIKTNDKGKIKSWKAYLNTCEGSAYIYLKNKDDKILQEKVRTIIDKFMREKEGIEIVYSSKEAEGFGADPNCFLMLEAERGYHFDESLEGSVIDKTRRGLKACHGYSPKKDNYTTCFMAYGKGIRKGTVLEKGQVIDIAPTLSKLLSVDLIDATGKTMEGILA